MTVENNEVNGCRWNSSEVLTKDVEKHYLLCQRPKDSKQVNLNRRVHASLEIWVAVKVQRCSQENIQSSMGAWIIDMTQAELSKANPCPHHDNCPPWVLKTWESRGAA